MVSYRERLILKGSGLSLQNALGVSKNEVYSVEKRGGV